MALNSLLVGTLNRKAKIENVATFTTTHHSAAYAGGYSYSIVPNYEHFDYFEINASVTNQLDFRGDKLTSIPNLTTSRILT
jgi:hypothetical protein